jgi:putative peptidoglycan lipid II flippase
VLKRGRVTNEDKADVRELGVEEAIVAADEAAAKKAEARAASESAKSSALVTAGIILSRIFGLARVKMQAYFFGLGPWADLLAAAFRVGNITQNLLGEGTLSASFIPIYMKLKSKGDVEASRRFALACFGLLLLVALAASIVGIIFAPWLTWLLAAGFDPALLESTVRAVRILFPMTGLLALSAWGLGVLNSHKRFFLPYAAPVVWNVAQMVGLYVAGRGLGLEGEALALAVCASALVGAVLQLLILLPSARRLLGSLKPSFDAKDPNVREAAKRLPAVLLGRGIIQISGLLDTGLATLLGVGAVAAFTSAQNIYLLPMAILGTGEAAVALPEMSADGAEEDRERRNAALRTRLGTSLARVTILTVPTMLAFMLLGHEITTVILRGGKFDHESAARVIPLLTAYGFALLGNASCRVLTTTCYALGDPKTPARYAIYRVVASAIGALGLMRVFGVLGIVLGSVIAAWVETFALGLKLRSQIGGLGLEKVPLARVLVLAVVTVGPAYGAHLLMPASMDGRVIAALGVLGIAGIAFLFAAPALKLLDPRSLLRRRK